MPYSFISKGDGNSVVSGQRTYEGEDPYEQQERTS